MFVYACSIYPSASAVLNDIVYKSQFYRPHCQIAGSRSHNPAIAIRPTADTDLTINKAVGLDGNQVYAQG